MNRLFTLSRLIKLVAIVLAVNQPLLISTVIASPISLIGSKLNYAISENNPPQSYRVLCYHDIRDDVLRSFNKYPEATAVDTQDFIKQMAWLKENDYHPISIKNILDAKAGIIKLPEKAVLLTFDDGFKSVYTKAFPVLKILNYPAVIAIVGEWIETPQGKDVAFGDASLPRSQFANWADIQEMVASGLVEVASHSHGLHKGIIANPQGNSLPAAVVHEFVPKNNSYESDAAHFARVKADLVKNTSLIESHLQQKPRVMIWPYGMYNAVALESSLEAGMPITMNLEDGANTANEPLSQIRRSLMKYDDGLPGLIRALGSPPSSNHTKISSEHVISINLDDIYDANAVVQEENISKMLDRIKRLSPSAVTVKAYYDLHHEGVAEALYFPNRHLPMRADLFSRVAWQLRTRVGVRVYAVMPVASFALAPGEPAYGHVISGGEDHDKGTTANSNYTLSVFDAVARNTIIEIYEDLAKSSIFTGILFGEDARLTANEDATPAAFAVYQNQWKLSDSIKVIQQDPVELQRWASLKTQYLDDFIAILTKKILEFQPDALTARRMEEKVVLDPQSEIHYAQNYLKSLSNYDFTIILVDQNKNNAKNNNAELNQFVKSLKNIPQAINKSLFEFKIDKSNSENLQSTTDLLEKWQQIHLVGARHFGYYLDDTAHNRPVENIIQPVISTQIEAIREVK